MDDRLTIKTGSTRKKARHPDRATLSPAHMQKIDGWIEQVTSAQRGVKITRNNMLSWLLDGAAPSLNNHDQQQIARQFYDEERFVREAIRELRRRRAAGEEGSLKDLLIQGSDITVGKKRTPRKSRQVSSTGDHPSVSDAGGESRA